MSPDGTLSDMRLHRLISFIVLAVVLLGTAGCSSIGYYSQAIGGHLKLMSAREPIDELLANDNTDPKLVEKLQTLIDARQFAVDVLALPDNKSYSTYVETGKRYVTWNVVAAEEFSVRAKTWCFPVAGCVSYKGYFAEQDAQAYAETLLAQNLDVNIGGASAYSTLGWFDDPVLDTMLSGGDIRYVSTLFHELAHQLLYVQDDSNFNEAFATFVEQEGIRIWLDARGESERIERYNAYLARNADFAELLKSTRSELVAAYQKDISDAEKRVQKQAVFERMQENYQELKKNWNGYAGYDGWFARKINNARLVSVATYHRLVPAFATIYADANNDLPAFYANAKAVAEMPAQKRREHMEALLARGASS